MRRAMVIGAAVAAMVFGAGTASAMSGGSPTPDRGDAPWMVTFAVKGDGPLLHRASCGGALVSARRVLTAAHCLDGVDKDGVEVHIGASTLSENPGTVRGVAGFEFAPDYEILPSPVAPDRPELSSARNDLAVVTLDAPVSEVAPLRPLSSPARSGTAAVFYGHGITSPSAGVSDVLRRGSLTVRTDASCAVTTPAVVDGPSVLCTRGEVQGCYGDSGGPLVVRDGHGRPRLAGVFSFGMETADKPCGATGINAFADVPALLG